MQKEILHLSLHLFYHISATIEIFQILRFERFIAQTFDNFERENFFFGHVHPCQINISACVLNKVDFSKSFLCKNENNKNHKYTL